MQQLKAGRTLAALAAALLVAGPVLAQTSGAAAGSNTIQSGTGIAVTSGTGLAVTPGTASASSTTVMGGPAVVTSTTTTLRTWPELPPNVEARADFQRWLRLK